MNEILFRGWDVRCCEWVYGDLAISYKKRIFIRVFDLKKARWAEYAVHPDSIGIYINKDDKTKWGDRPKEWLHIPKEEWKGIPIFCGCNGAKYGSDIVELCYNNLGKIVIHGVCGEWNYKNTEVISNQWEEHLKEQHK
jgi:hypothetical protein